MMRNSSLEQELRAGRTVPVPTKGDSMQPLLYEGRTLAVLAPVSAPLRRGDVVLYKRLDSDLVLHRVVRVQGDCYLIRGDNCYYEEQVYPEQVLGVMTEVVRNGKTIRVADAAYRCYAVLWMGSYPLRHLADRLRRLPDILRRKRRNRSEQ